MAINFPDSPSVNDTHTVGDKTWTWDGTAWNVVVGGIPTTIDTLTINQNAEVDGILTANHIHGNLAGSVYLHVKNTSGSEIAAGTPVYATGSVGASGATEVSPSDASTAGTMPAVGITQSTLAINAEGHATILGVIGSQDTSTYSLNQPLYVAPGGGLTATRPTAATDAVQSIARVVRVDASSGELLVMGAGRTNDVPNEISILGDLTVDTDTLHVDSTNNRVGIGTTTPTVPLDVVGDVNIATASGDGYLQVLYQAIDTALYANLTASGQMDAQEVSLFAQNPNTETSVPLRLTGSTVHVVGDLNVDQDTLFVDASTNRVGIGTTSPDVPLHVDGDAGNHEIAKLQSSQTTATYSLVGITDANETAKGFVGFNPGASLNNTDSYLMLGMNGDDVNGGTGLIVKKGGSVGIGTSSPSYRLDVNGDSNAQGYARSKGKKLGMALIYEGSLSGTTSTFLGTFSADWLNYRIVIDAAQNGNGGWTFFRFVDSTNNSIQSGYYTGFFLNGSYNTQAGQGGAVAIYSEYYAYGGMIMDITLPYQGDHPSFHLSSAGHNVNGNAIHSLFANGYCATTSDITGFQFYNGAPYGSVKVYGY